jgi:hypothetical protein
MRGSLVILSLALSGLTICVTSAPAMHFTLPTISGKPTAPSGTRWCDIITVGDTSFRIRAHNLLCPTARSLATRYVATGSHPRGYFCAADILYCWTKGHKHWFRGYPYTPPPPPAPPPPVALSGHYKGTTSQNEDFEFDVLPNATGISHFVTGQINQGCTPPDFTIYGNNQNAGNYTVPIASDGTWTIDATYQSYLDNTYPTSNHIKVTGHMNGSVGTGNLELTTTFAAFGKAYTCDSGLVTWTVSRIS